MKENMKVATAGEPTGRLTRARAAACKSTAGPDIRKQQDQARVLRNNSKRSALDEGNTNAPVTRKRRAVLKDVTNVLCDNSYSNCLNAAKFLKKNGKRSKKGLVDVSKVAPSPLVETRELPLDSETNICREIRKVVLRSAELEGSISSDKNKQIQLSTGSGKKENNTNITCSEKGGTSLLKKFKKAGKVGFYNKYTTTTKPDYINIDSDHKDPQLCSLYAPEIYSNLRAAELIRRPPSDFMETLQRDITQSMRGILVDWLVEVCEEYKLVADTLYLTVHLIDLFLSQHIIERQKLQLLGITCMLIASKYEEICAPRVEEFCFITDSTYTKVEVLEMESQVLNHLGFQLAAPTAKTFLRRFLRAAQASYKSPSLELEFLANYLTELTLVDYNFLQYIPSLIAASAVFLARWTLDQSSHPWSPTLEHYTGYISLDLKPTVFALQSLQANTSGCPLNAIRAKYKQEKFKSVAALTSPKLLETIFEKEYGDETKPNGLLITDITSL